MSGSVRQQNRSARVADRGWRQPAVDLVCLVAGLALFSRLHDLTGTNAAVATTHARTLQAVERSLHLNIEIAANRWLTSHAVLMQAAVLCYRLYYLPLAGVLLWVLLLRPAEVYRSVRRTMVVMGTWALLVFWLFPVSPPRLALGGIVDVVADHDPLGGGGSRDLTNGQNHFSAMPSLHVGWSALCAYAAWLALRANRPRLSWLCWLFPVLMIADVVATGNHYVLDVLGSAALLAGSVGVAKVWDRCRRGQCVRTQTHCN
jgi:membrane-associated phospholipid phosphatase